jgi:hypothetical protein
VRSPYGTPTLRALQFGDVDVLRDLALGFASAKRLEIEENRAEPDSVALDASQRTT